MDENEYHLGLTTYEGSKKPAWFTMKKLIDPSILHSTTSSGS